MEDLKVGDELIPSWCSPFKGTPQFHSFFQVKGFEGKHIVVFRDGWHTFTALPCYFVKLNTD